MLFFSNNKNNTFTNPQLFILSALVSAILLFVCSKNSLIYSMNDSIDVNIFFSVTDAMFHGKVLYTDIFEHKGPFLYVIYGLVHILGNSYFTLYLFECIANALFVYFGTKIILLYDKDAIKSRIFLYALSLEFCLCTSTTFMFGGTVEELCLWMSAFGLYVTIRCLKHDEYYAAKEIVTMGLLCGALFWTKYSLLGFYSGLALYVFGWNIAQRNFARLGKTIALFLGGFAIASIPTLLYCSLTRSFADMVNVYFIGNIWGNITTSSSMAHLYALMNNIYKDIAIALLILFGTFYVLKYEPQNIKLLLLTTIISAFLASCCLKVFWTYYPMPMLIFIPFGIIASKKTNISREYKIGFAALMVMLHLFASIGFGIYSPIVGNDVNLDWLKEHIRVLAKATVPLLLLYAIFRYYKTGNTRHELKRCACILALCALAGFVVRDPFYFTTDQELPQKRFAETIKQVQNANILVYGSYDYGFFKSSNTWPQVKYFNNVNLEEENTDEEQLRYIKEELPDFIITHRSLQEIKSIIHETSYKLIDTSGTYYYNGYTRTYYLYEKTGANSDVLKSTTMAIGG